MQAKTFVFFGIVGSGKGTQAKLLQEYLKSHDGRELVYVSPGNEYRKIKESNTQTALLVKESVDQGKLLPDFLTNSVFVSILVDNLSEEKHLITDGYPRSIDQAKCFEDAVEFYGRGEVSIIYIELSKEEAIKRMQLRGRHDDTEDGIARRFEEYTNNVIPAMKHFEAKERHTIYTINGDQSIEKVHEDIIKALGI
jgi:adenylate kinase